MERGDAMPDAVRSTAKLTYDDLVAMFSDEDGVRRELIDGELIEMSPQGPLHRARTVRVRRLLEAAFGTGFHVQDRSPIEAGPSSLPAPDVAVIRTGLGRGRGRHDRGADLLPPAA